MAPQQSATKIGVTGNKQHDDRTVKPRDFISCSFEIRKPETVILLLKSVEQPVVVQAISTLDKYAVKDQANLINLYELGLLLYILPLTLSEDNCIRRFAIKLLAEMCSLQQVRTDLIYEEYVIPHFIEVLLREEDIIIQEYASLFLAEMTRERYSCVKAMENPILGILLSRMVSSDPDIQKNSLQILVNILNDPACAQELSQSEEMDLKPMIAHVQSEYPAIQSLAIQALHNLLQRQDENLHKQFCQGGGTEVTLNILKKLEWRDIHKNVLTLLETSATKEETVKYICLDAASVRLKRYMRTIRDTDLIEATLAVIAKIATFDIGREVLYEDKLELEMCELLKLGTANIVGPSCKGLALMARDPESLKVIISAKPTKDIMNVIVSDSYAMETRITCSQALSELLRLDKNICQALLEDNRQDILESLLCLPKDIIPVEMKLCLVACFKQIIYHEDLRAKMLEGDLINALICCFKDTDRSCLPLFVETCYTLANALCDVTARAQFLKSNGVQYIIECLKNRNLTLNQASAAVIVVTSCDLKVTRAFIKAGALDWMLQEKEKKTRFECPVWETAIEAIFRCHLPIKFAYMNRLDPLDITEEGFYVAQHVERPFLMLEDLLEKEVSPIRPIYVANFQTENKMLSTTSLEPSSKSLKCSRTSIGKQKISTSVRKRDTSSPKKYMAEINECSLQEMSIHDQYLPRYLEVVKKKIEDLNNQNGPDKPETSMLEKITRIVAKVVCDQMSGFDPNLKCDIHRQELHLNELKIELGTNIIQLGYIRVGLYLERAMLFKVLADRIGLPCSLVRGEYQRAWVEVAIPETIQEEISPPLASVPTKSSSFLTTPSGHLLHHTTTQWLPQPEPEPEIEFKKHCIKKLTPNCLIKPNRVVDLMDKIGSLYPLNSYKALQYCNKPQIY